MKRLNDKIKKNWDRLTEDEILLYYGSQDEFYATVKAKYGIFREDAKRRMDQFERSSRRLFFW